jgi:hypothetical protein
MKAAGVINRKGKLMDAARTKEIRKYESEINMVYEPPKSSLKKEFNLKDKIKH